jgi:replicative DNA helicase
LAKIDSFLVEQNILSILFKKPRLIYNVTSQIKPGYFSDNPNRKQNKAIFMCMDFISRKNDVEDLQFDSMTILSVVNKHKKLAESLKRIFPKQEDFIHYIESLKESPIDPSNLNIHLEELKKINIANDLQNDVGRYLDNLPENYKKMDQDEIIRGVETEVLEITNKYNADEQQTFISANKDRLERYKNYKPNNNEFVGLPTPFPMLNKFTGGLLRKGSVTVINARSNVGKSLIVKNIAVFLAIEHNIPVYLGTTETLPIENEHRILKELTGLPMIIIENNLYNSKRETIEVDGKTYDTETCRKKVLNAVKKLDEAPIYFDQIRGYDATVLAQRARYFKRRHNIKLFAFDYIKESSSPEAQKKPLRLFLAEVTEVLKEQVADKLEIPVLTCSQANQHNVLMPNESSDIWRFSTAFLVLRKLKEKDKQGFEGDYGISVTKNRYGKVHPDPMNNRFSLDLNVDKLRFEEVEY